MAKPMRSAIHHFTETHNALVEIGAAGLTGEGVAFTLSPGQAEAVCAVAAELARPLLGAPLPEPTEARGAMVSRLNLTGRTGIGLLAVAAIDTALWDLAARAAAVPLYRLAGGTSRSFPVYAQPGWLSMPVEQVIEEALAFVANGIRHYKMRVGSRDWRLDVARVEQVRAALPGDVELLVDANQGWALDEALEGCRALDELGLYWIEEPVDALDFEGHAAVAAAVATPVAAGETLFWRRELLGLVEAGGADVLMPDLQHCGGPSGFLEALRDPRIRGLPVSNHLFPEASVHLLCAAGSPSIVEWMPGWWDELFDRLPDVVDGAIRPPEEPGIGYRLSERAAGALQPVRDR
jgi:mandelate racemase